MWALDGASGPAGWDRRRVGARLRAALAGLHELQGLRARQQERVRGALAMQPPPPPAAPRGSRAHELRLEAALAALQEQLAQLRHQDLGLKTHLDQLDQRINALQLDVCGTPTEGPDSDSRPSSGFYELSDGGSCSLSASCTSVCSDRLSSSPATLLPTAPKARTSAGDCRPWSADETTIGGPPPPVWGLRALEGSANRPLPCTARPRPVSTGDLERVPPAQEAGVEAKPAPLLGRTTDLPPHALDLRFQRDLVSRGGREVYPYPSPLHAVALQSPLFAVAKETLRRDRHLPAPRGPLPSPPGPTSARTAPVLEAGSARAYIDRLLELRGQGKPPGGAVSEQGPPGCKGSPSQGAGSLPARPAGSPGRAGVAGEAQRRAAGGDSPPHPGRLSEDRRRPSSGCVCVAAVPGPPQLQAGSPTPCSRAQQAAPDGWVATAGSPTTMTPGPCAHPHSVASGAPAAGLRVGRPAGHPTTKAVRVRRGPSGWAQRPGRPPPPWGALIAPQMPPAWGAGLRRRPVQAGKAPGRSCSESSLYPVSFLVPLLVGLREGPGASSYALSPSDARLPVAAAAGREARRRQRRWQSSVEISARAQPAGAQGPSPGLLRPAVTSGGGPPPACPHARPRLPRQDPRARSESSGSELSAERASLFRSAIPETSEDEASGHTARRLGDRESGDSGTAGGVQGAGSRPAWLGVAPGSSRPPPLPPAPKLCRVRASRALKKKIRRFQPAALKVMTLV